MRCSPSPVQRQLGGLPWAPGGYSRAAYAKPGEETGSWCGPRWHTHAYNRGHLHAHTHVHAHIYSQRTCACAQVHGYGCVHVCVRVYPRACAGVEMHTYTSICTCTHRCPQRARSAVGITQLHPPLNSRATLLYASGVLGPQAAHAPCLVCCMHELLLPSPFTLSFPTCSPLTLCSSPTHPCFLALPAALAPGLTGGWHCREAASQSIRVPLTGC